MTTFVWTINKLYTLPLVDGATDVVVTATYVLTGTQDATSSSMVGSSQFAYTGGQFIPFASLTQSEVLDWVFAALGENGVNSMEQCVEGQLNAILRPPVPPEAQPLPWL